MRLDREQRDLLNELYDEAVLGHGRDHVGAAKYVVEELRALEAGGHLWAAEVIDACVLDGMTKRIKGRAKRSRVSVPSKTGRVASMPTHYARRRADGAVQMELWLDIPLDELAEIITSISRQAGTLNQRASRMQLGHDLAVEHGVGTAREGFAVAGMSVTADDEAVAS